MDPKRGLVPRQPPGRPTADQSRARRPEEVAQVVQTAARNGESMNLVSGLYTSAGTANRPSILNTVKRPRAQEEEGNKEVKYAHMPPPPIPMAMIESNMRTMVKSSPTFRAPPPPPKKAGDVIVSPRRTPPQLPAIGLEGITTTFPAALEGPVQARVPQPPTTASEGARKTANEEDYRQSPFAFIEKIRAQETESTVPKDFIYLEQSANESSVYNPYALHVVPYSQKNPNNHYTMSVQGVMHVGNGSTDFCTLNQWEREHKIFHQLFDIPFFRKFRRWKTFYFWKRHVRTTAIQTYKDFLEENLFILDPDLCPSLLSIRKLCLEVLDMSMYRSDHATETLDKYIAIQQHRRDEVGKDLARISTTMTTLIGDACKARMRSNNSDRMKELSGITTTESPSDLPEGAPTIRSINHKPKKSGYRDFNPADYLDVHSPDQPSVQSCTELAQKREQCRRLTNFIRLSDYMLIDVIVIMCTTSTLHAQKRLSYPILETEEQRLHKENLAEQQRIEREKYRQKYGEPEAEEGEDEPWLHDLSDPPIFTTDILFEENSLVVSPPMQQFEVSIDHLLNGFFQSISKVERFLKMECFWEYTEPVIADQTEERDRFGAGPDVIQMVTAEADYQQLVVQIKGSMSKAWEDVEQYCATFESFKELYIENSTLDTEEIKAANHNLDWFKDVMDKYKKQFKDISAIRNKQRVGLYIVVTQGLKEFLLPSPTNCLEATQNLLPVLGQDQNKKLLEIVTDAVQRLERPLTCAEDYVEFMKFHTSITERMEELEQTYENVRDMYSLMDNEDLPVKNEELMAFKTGTVDGMGKLRMRISAAEEEKESQIRKFSSELDNRMENLREELGNIQKRSEHSMISDLQSDMAEVIEYTAKLQESVAEVQAEANRYSDYQELFGSEVTRLEEIFDLNMEISTKNKLWVAMRDWQLLSAEWYNTVFHQIDPDDVSLEVAKYTKTVAQVSRAMPDNQVCGKLKGMVEDFKAAVPVIQAMRNPVLRQHHWTQIDELVGEELSKEEGFTFGRLVDLKVIDLHEEIQHISNTATQEAALEDLLAKVSRIWVGGTGSEGKLVEFVVNPYKEHKDVYVLGSVDDIVTQLEDSGVIVSTVISSRYCMGALKIRTEKWEEEIKYMSDALDKWLEFQRNWMYLESIFGSAEIARQWPQDAKTFAGVDKQFKDLMRRVFENPCVYRIMISNLNVMERFDKGNKDLERILNNLEKKLEEKRRHFPRFYFLSNDDLLDILSQIKNPAMIQPHLLKMFDNIKNLGFGSNGTDVLSIQSAEGEVIQLAKQPKARGEVEKWLLTLEHYMVLSLRRLAKVAVQDYETKDRTTWIFDHPVQLILTVSQIYWCEELVACLEGPGGLKTYQQVCYKNLGDLANLTSRPLDKIQRKMLTTLITTDVHSRDLVDQMVDEGVEKQTQFGWQKQLRSYWETGGLEGGEVVLRQNNSVFTYGYEYQGAQPRLVITPLTDRIYMTVTGALKLCLGSAPSGPAGTGKTETVKDMAKCLAFQCIIYNCSDGVTYKMMEKFFSGLAQCGAWCCLDEFNRINIEVLSVIASQLNEVRQALLARVSTFTFQGVPDVDIKPNFGAFITMNPGYAGRTELPDNLKVLFRNVAVMTPDFRMIAEVILFSEGFKDAKSLSLKITQLFKLSSEQLSPQDHYDFGMRALKSILVMAGGLKRGSPDVDEEVVLIRACRDANIPKFVAEDIPLFNGILADLFPGIVLPAHDYGELQRAFDAQIDARLLQHIPTFNVKITQLYETLVVRHGVMLVGPTGSGKTVNRDVMRDALTMLREEGSENQFAQKVQQYDMNPKSISYGELYGEMNLFSGEWKDGVCAIIAKQCVADTTEDMKWILFDGPVDTLWIESMNSVLDDSKLLCLDNGVRIKLPDTVRMIFEVMDLSVASPATTSRCGMVYMNPAELGWKPVIATWLTAKIEAIAPDAVVILLRELFDTYVEKGLNYVMKECKFMIQTVDINLVTSLCDLFLSLLVSQEIDLKAQEPSTALEYVKLIFTFSYVWALGGNVNQPSQEKFDNFVRDALESVMMFPAFGMVFDFQMDMTTRKFISWETSIPEFKYDPNVPFFQILVPTIDTVRYSYLIKTLVQAGKPVMLNGVSGTGKSILMNASLNDSIDTLSLQIIGLQFSAQTSAARTQEMIESKLKVKRKNLLGAQPGKKVVIFVDDINMPAVEEFGAQPPIEILRQMLGMGGFYDRKQLFWKHVQDVSLTAACGPPEGGRSAITPRMVRFFHLLFIPELSEDTLRRIFSSILAGFFQSFPADVAGMNKSLTNSSVEIYQRIKEDLRPRPTTSHYTFNLRDLSKVFQGIMQVTTRTCKDTTTCLNLWIHENMRCFYDRLVDDTDRRYFTEDLMMDVLKRNFHMSKSHEELFEGDPILFGDFAKFGMPMDQRMYEEVQAERLSRLFGEYLDEYNLTTSKAMNLVFFKDHCNHLTRIIRILRQPRGNALLVGVGGSGKQSLTRLGAAIQEYKCSQIEVSKSYNITSFRTDLVELYNQAGIEGHPIVFLFADNQIVDETMLEDINGMLNTGEVPNLFAPEDKEKAINACAEAANAAGQGGSRDNIYAFFINKVRDNLHIVLCMSPVGDSFRRWTRQFPSLVNCCTIDWFDPWPREALMSVAERLMESVAFSSDEERGAIQSTCVEIHVNVGHMAQRFYDELRRYFFVTPTSYLEFVSLYKSLLAEKRQETNTALSRIENGKVKMKETNQQVDEMQVQLTAMQPKLKAAREATEVLMKDLSVRKSKAQEVQAQVSVTAKEAQEAQEVAAHISADAQKDLDEAMPQLETALKSLDALNKNDIGEIRGYSNAPKAVLLTMSAVLIVLKEPKLDWDYAKSILANPNFIQRLKDYDKDNIPASVITKLQKYINDPDFTPEKVATGGSAACKSLCMWCRAMELYYRVSRTVAPKKAALAEANATLDKVNKTLNEAMTKLKAVEDELEGLQKSFDKSVKEKEDLEYNIDLSSKRLTAASALTGSLANEVVRWDALIETMKEEQVTLAGNVFVSSACIAYQGAFTASFRTEMTNMWVEICREKGLAIRSDFSLVSTLATPVQMREWAIMSLPTDNISLENAIMVTVCCTPQSKRWPLLIDPQGQAFKWISKMEAKNGLKVIKLSDANYLRTLEQAIRNGNPVIVQDMGETLDPALDPILLKQVYQANGRTLINLGGPDNATDYDPNFKFYMTTKIANPKYLPDVCIKVAVINFTVTMQGLEEQMLGDAVALEKAELEETKNKIIQSVANDKKMLKQYEDGILEDLESASGNILDNERVISSLKKAQTTSDLLSKRLKEAEIQSADINKARLEYTPVATRASILYFVIADLGMIDPMYQYSLDYFKKLFTQVVNKTESHANFKEHLNVLIENITEAVYQNICQGLFKKDKLIFSFLFSVQILRHAKKISEAEWQFMIRGAAQVKAEDEDSCPLEWLDGKRWALLCAMDRGLPAFKGLTDDILARSDTWKEWIHEKNYTNDVPLAGPNLGSADPSAHCKDASNWEKAKAILDGLEMDTANRPDPKTLKDAMTRLSEKGNFKEAGLLSQYLCPADDVGAKWAALSQLQRALLVKTCRPPHFLFSVTEFVKWELGEKYIDPPPFNIDIATKDANAQTPIIFILSPGADPFSLLLQYAGKMGYRERLHVVSLGQGQGENAKKVIDIGKRTGDWVILQNCHLSKSFMPELERQIANFSSGLSAINDSFRLWLTSMPSAFFPIPILQNSIKLTNENPTGIRANLLRCYVDFKSLDKFGPDDKDFPECSKENAYHKLLYGLAFFHSILNERKKFGPLGWNTQYEFNDTDLDVGKQWLEMFLEEQDIIPWDALHYVIGQIVYGGRVTDPWDRRTLLSILGNFLKSEMLVDEAYMSASGIYQVPKLGDLDSYRRGIREMPHHDDPEIFGMHENANITFQLQECDLLMFTVLSIQPRATSKSSEGALSPEELVAQKVVEFQNTCPALLDLEQAGPHTFRVMPNGLPYSLSTVLSHEIGKFNKLLSTMQHTLKELQKALKGLTVLSEQLDAMFNAFLNNQVPGLWAAKAYPSLKPLGSWFKDLVERVDFIRKWLRKGDPPAFWLSGLFYPHGFMTGTLQAFARQFSTSVDVLGFAFEVLDGTVEDIEKGPEAGVYVYGLFLDSCRWDAESRKLVDSHPGESYSTLPPVHFLPQQHHVKPDDFYACPLYKTTIRKGNLSSLGQSTNFVLAVELPSPDQDSNYWVQKGSALVCALND